MSEFVRVPCRTADVIRDHPAMKPLAGCSDLGGEFGPPEIYTEWGFDDGTVVMRESRFPALDGGPDRKPCEHFVSTNTEANDDCP